jgi:hypothetical protein
MQKIVYIVITIFVVNLFVGCGGGGGYHHTQFISVKVESKDTIELKDKGISPLMPTGNRIVFEVAYKSKKPQGWFIPLIDKCKNGIPNKNDMDKLLSSNYGVETFIIHKDIYQGYLFFTSEDLKERNLVDIDGIVQDDICLFSRTNIIYNNMKDDDIVTLKKEDLQIAYDDYIKKKTFKKNAF